MKNKATKQQIIDSLAKGTQRTNVRAAGKQMKKNTIYKGLSPGFADKYLASVLNPFQVKHAKVPDACLMATIATTVELNFSLIPAANQTLIVDWVWGDLSTWMNNAGIDADPGNCGLHVKSRDNNVTIPIVRYGGASTGTGLSSVAWSNAAGGLTAQALLAQQDGSGQASSLFTGLDSARVVSAGITVTPRMAATAKPGRAAIAYIPGVYDRCIHQSFNGTTSSAGNFETPATVDGLSRTPYGGYVVDSSQPFACTYIPMSTYEELAFKELLTTAGSFGMRTPSNGVWQNYQPNWLFRTVIEGADSTVSYDFSVTLNIEAIPRANSVLAESAQVSPMDVGRAQSTLSRILSSTGFNVADLLQKGAKMIGSTGAGSLLEAAANVLFAI